MPVANRMGSVPFRDAAVAGLSRRWLIGCAATAAAAHWLLAGGGDSLSWPHPMIALALLALVADRSRLAASPATRWDGLLFVLALLSCMAPFRTSAMLALACAAAMALRVRGVAGQSSGVLLLALAGWGLKDGVWAGFASVPVLWAEAHAVSGLLGLGGIAAQASGNQIFLADGHGFVVLRACSVLSLAYPCAVGTYALCRLLRPALRPSLARIAVALALLLVLNTSRLVAMAASPGIYGFLHAQTGVLPLQLAWAGIILVAALPYRHRG